MFTRNARDSQTISEPFCLRFPLVIRTPKTRPIASAFRCASPHNRNAHPRRKPGTNSTASRAGGRTQSSAETLRSGATDSTCDSITDSTCNRHPIRSGAPKCTQVYPRIPQTRYLVDNTIGAPQVYLHEPFRGDVSLINPVRSTEAFPEHEMPSYRAGARTR